MAEGLTVTIRTLIIVPARSGSKGIVDKNVRLLAGKPLLVWTADAIRQAGVPDSLAILSTDSDAYAAIGRAAGLAVPFSRSADCSGDAASALQVVEHAVTWFVGAYGYTPERVMWLQPTSPFRPVASLNDAVARLDAGQADAVVGCKTLHRDLTSLFRCDDVFLVPLSREPTQTSRQQVQPLLTPNGAMYVCKTDRLLAQRSFYPERTMPLVMNAVQSLDIDTEEDWAMAEAFIRQGLV